jgi:hypothetical protein
MVRGRMVEGRMVEASSTTTIYGNGEVLVWEDIMLVWIELR